MIKKEGKLIFFFFFNQVFVWKSIVHKSYFSYKNILKIEIKRDILIWDKKNNLIKII